MTCGDALSPLNTATNDIMKTAYGFAPSAVFCYNDREVRECA